MSAEETTPPPVDPYATRPNRSQEVAAAHRARDAAASPYARQPQAPPPGVIFQGDPLLMGAIGLIAFGVIGLMIWAALNSSPVQLDTPIADSVLQALTTAPAPTPAAAASPIPLAAEKTINLYWSPGGEVKRAIPADSKLTALHHGGSDWILVETDGWVRRSDRPDLPIVGTDLLAQPVIMAAPTPIPPQEWCAEAGTAAQKVTACGYGDHAAIQAEADQKWRDQLNQANPSPTSSTWYADIATPDVAVITHMVGPDPAAKACQNAQGTPSPLCGGITNADAMNAIATFQPKP